VQLVVQAQARAGEQRRDRLDRDPEYRADLGIREPFEPRQRERGALLGTQAPGRRRQPTARPRRRTASEQLEARLASGAQARDAELLPRALQARKLGVGDQERVLRGVGRHAGVAEDPMGERERARAVLVPERGVGCGFSRRCCPDQLGLIRRRAHGGAS
jgi:hypothetical protein